MNFNQNIKKNFKKLLETHNVFVDDTSQIIDTHNKRLEMLKEKHMIFAQKIRKNLQKLKIKIQKRVVDHEKTTFQSNIKNIVHDIFVSNFKIKKLKILTH